MKGAVFEAAETMEARKNGTVLCICEEAAQAGETQTCPSLLPNSRRHGPAPMN